MHKTYITIPSVFAAMLLASGCSTMGGSSFAPWMQNNTAQSSATDQSAGAVDDAETARRRVSELESELAARNSALESAEAQLAAQQGASTAGASGLLPPNPQPGACYARILVPARYRDVTEQVLVSEAAEQIEVVPARLETVQERVLVKEASKRIEVVPAVYEEVEERVMIKPASTRMVEVPARYETATERVLVTPAYTEWKKGPAVVQTANVVSETVTDTGEIMCLVEVPATYRTIEKRVLVSPARTQEVAVPAEYASVTKMVLKTPATTREVTVPAEYDTVEISRVVSPASERRTEIPARYETVTRTERFSDERVEWRQVLCEVNMTRANILALQRALAERGYYRAGIDGIIGPQTLGAARSFAVDRGLPAGSNYVAMEVIAALDLDL